MTQIPFPNISERRPNFLTLGFRNDPSITGYRLLVADTLNRAYGDFNGVSGAPGPQVIFDPTVPANPFKMDKVHRGEDFVTSSIRRRGNIFVNTNIRTQTLITYDPEELIGIVTNAPPDDNLIFMRAQVTTVANPTFFAPDNNTMSDILIIPPFGYNNVPRPSLSLYGTAPNLGTAILGQPAPSEALVFHVPNFGDAIDLKNHGMGDLYYASGKNLPLIRIPAGEDLSLASGMKDELVLCANGANPNFSIVISTVAGLR